MTIALTVVLSVAAVWAGYVLLTRLAASLESNGTGGAEAEQWTPGMQVGAEGIAYLFAHKFIAPVDPERISPRNRTQAPVTEDSLDARRWVESILYAVLADHYLNERIECEVVESAPTFMPPLPHKPWSLRIRLVDALPASPLSDVIETAFEEVTAASDEADLALDELLERIVRQLRRDLKFWRRTGLCAQVLEHLQRAMVHLGYLEEVSGDTVLERVRSPVFRTVKETASSLESEAEALRDRLAEFERWHSLPDSATDEDVEQLPGGLDPRLGASQAGEASQWMADCLRLSVYEAVTSLRQLEPSDEFLQ